MYEYYEIEMLLQEVADYVEETTVLSTYLAMDEPARVKYRERLTIITCKTHAPRRNYDISMDTIRSFIGDILADMEAKSKEAAG